MSAPEVQAQETPRRPLRMQFMADLDLNEWVERRRRDLDKSASEFLYDIVSRAKVAEEAA